MSPTIYRENGYRYFFFSLEEERRHIHVISGDGEAKFWLEPEIELAKSFSYSQKDLKEIEKVIKGHYNEFVDAWNEHFFR
jgi:diadenosine tetraphosphate (Ap4A) HIT family hydrolase